MSAELSRLGKENGKCRCAKFACPILFEDNYSILGKVFF